MVASPKSARSIAAPLLVGLVALVLSACAPPTPPTPPGISFNPPKFSYVGKQLVPKATSSSGLPVSFSLDATSTGCTLIGDTLYFDAVGECVVNADQPGDGTIPADPQVQRTISVYDCPPLRSGLWTGPLDLSANVVASASSFTGTVDLTSLGYGVQVFEGFVSCDEVSMTFNGTPLSGRLSPDGSRLTSSYQGIAIVLNAPA